MLDAIIIGCGNIGVGFDGPVSENILTHANAYRQTEGMRLVGVVDNDPAKSATAGEKWGCAGFDNIETCLAELSPDVISICTPTQVHKQSIIESVKSYRPRLVFCEKPISDSVIDTIMILQLLENNNIPIVVNYVHRFSPALRAARQEILDGGPGKFLSGHGIYTKGLLNNGSHMIDLIRYLLGDIKDFKVLGGRVDHQKTDPSVDIYTSLMNHESGVYLSTGDKGYYDIFELDLLFEKKRYRLLDLGLKFSIQEVQMSREFKGYNKLSAGEEIDSGYSQAFKIAVEDIRDHLTAREPLSGCSGMEALATQELCEAAIKKYTAAN